MNAHASLDPALQGAGLVKREVVPGALLQQTHDPFQGLRSIVLARGGRVAHPGRIGLDAGRQCRGRADDVGTIRGHGAARHGLELRRPGLLGHGQAAYCLDGQGTQRAVGAHAGEHDSDGPFSLVAGQGGEQHIDR